MPPKKTQETAPAVVSKTKLPAELVKVASDTKMSDMTLAEKIASNYVPFIEQIEAQVAIYKTLKKGDAADADRARRVALDLGKICSRITEQKKIDKDYYLIVSRYIDGLFNAIEGRGRLTQAEAKEIANFFENLERERIAKLAAERTALMLPFHANASMLNLGALGEEEFQGLFEAYQVKDKIEKEKQAAEAERLRKEEEAKALENERLRKENEILQKQMQEQNALRSKRLAELHKYQCSSTLDLGLISEEEYEKELAGAKIFFDKAEAIKKVEEEKRKQEKEALAKAQKELQDKKAEEEKKKKEAEAAALALAKSSDNEKLKAWINSFSIPACSSEFKNANSYGAVNIIESKFSAFKAWAKKEINNL